MTTIPLSLQHPQTLVGDQHTSTLPTGRVRTVTVVVVGRENDFRDRVCDALVDSGAVVEVIDPGSPELRTRHSGLRRSSHVERSPISHRDGLQSYVFTVTNASGSGKRSLGSRWRHRWARRTEMERLLAAAADATSTPDSCRILVVGEESEIDQNRSDPSWIANLARDVAYEAVINGTHVESAAYIPLADGTGLPGSLRRVADWCTGRNRREPGRADEQGAVVPEHMTRQTMPCAIAPQTR